MIGTYMIGRLFELHKPMTPGSVKERRFTAFFGIQPKVLEAIWLLLGKIGWMDVVGPKSLHPKHLLWAFMFAKRYECEEVLSSTAGCDEKTFRKWAWFYIEGVANLDMNVVSFYLNVALQGLLIVTTAD